MSLKKLIHPTLIFIFSISLKSFASCLPVSFDHIFFNVSPKAYEQIGKSDFFKTDHLSFFEAFKNPFGDHRGHYITGQKHYLEVFNSKDRKNKAPIGIGFISETKNCLPIIQQALQSSLPDFFKMRKKENWGQMTEALTTNMHLWVSELDPNFLGSSNEKIDRIHYLNWIRKANGDDPKAPRLSHIQKIQISLPKIDAQLLESVFSQLRWRKIDWNQNSVTLSNGETTLIISESSSPKVQEIQFVVDPHQAPKKDKKCSEVFLSLSETDLLWMNTN
jgi:hypothetical protein